MNKTIWKFNIKSFHRGDIIISIPSGFKILQCAIHPDKTLAIWAAVPPHAEEVEINILIRFTGESEPEKAEYIGTVIDSNNLVYHIYWN